MKKIVKKTLLIIPVLCLVAIIFIIGYHKISVWRESKQFPPIGTMVTVNAHDMHVYSEGGGDDTLVFLSGFGTASPALDFKALYEKLSDDYKIVVIERAGCGFSEITNASRDIDTVLEETRLALQLTGETGPFILFPHSMSGLEAIYWAQKYPDEVKAIVGLDATVPEYYINIGTDLIEENCKALKKTSFFLNLGLARFIPDLYQADPAMTGNVLTDEEKAMYKAIVLRVNISSNMIDEAAAVYDNARTVDNADIPVDTPMYFFISDESETGSGWQDMLISYISKINNGKYMILDCGHSIHDLKPDLIAIESRKFIEELNK